MDKRKLDFDDVIEILKDAEGSTCEMSVAPEVTPVEWSNVAHFEGIVGDVDETAHHGDILIRILSSPDVRAGWIHLRRARFRSATLEGDEEPPQTLTVWQRGIRVQLQLWPHGTSRSLGAGPAESADDVPF